jgi:hypothetical protein
MDDTKREWVRSWLVKAHSDLRSARALVDLADPATEVHAAIAHAQAVYDLVLRQIPPSAHPKGTCPAGS